MENQKQLYTPTDLAFMFSHEEMDTPIVLGGQIYYLTTLALVCNSSGNDILLVKNTENEYKMINLGWEPDCDGSFYTTYEVKSIEDLESAYSVNDSLCINKDFIWNLHCNHSS